MADCCRVLFLTPRRSTGGNSCKLVYHGGWLLTHPDEDFACMALLDLSDDESVGQELNKQVSSCMWGLRVIQQLIMNVLYRVVILKLHTATQLAEALRWT